MLTVKLFSQQNGNSELIISCARFHVCEVEKDHFSICTFPNYDNDKNSAFYLIQPAYKDDDDNINEDIYSSCYVENSLGKTIYSKHFTKKMEA